MRVKQGRSQGGVIVVSICVSLAFLETWAELGFLCNKMPFFELVVFVTMSRLQKIDDLFSPIDTAKNPVIMRKEFESRHFSGPYIDYIDETPIPAPRRQSDDKAAKDEAANQQRKHDLHPRSQRSKSKMAY